MYKEPNFYLQQIILDLTQNFNGLKLGMSC